MKRLFLLSIAALLPFSAMANPLTDNGFFFKPYVGADYQYYSVDYSGITGSSASYSDFFADSLNGGDIHVGARVHKYLGFEAGYFDTASASTSNILGTTLGSSVRVDGWTLDAMGYLPLGESQKFELIGTIGLADSTAHLSLSAGASEASGSKSETKGRIGAGAQYWITENLNVRGLVRYQDANFGGTTNDVVVTSLGLDWQF